MLSDLGYSLLKADNAEQALAVLSSGAHIDLLYTVVVMPGRLRRPELAKQAVQLLPRLKVLFTLGYMHNAIVHGGRLDPGAELLGKPYSCEDLARKIRQRFDTGDTPLPVVAPVASHGLAGLWILVVEDDSASRTAVCELLEVPGHRPVAVGTAAVAREMLSAQVFDVLLTDAHLPEFEVGWQSGLGT